MRFRDDANDGAVRTVVAQAANDIESGRDAFRAELNADERDTLRLFAERRILAARRQRRSAFSMSPWTPSRWWVTPPTFPGTLGKGGTFRRPFARS